MEQKGFHRKLTAILSTDVAGYSRLIQDDETATVKTLKAYKKIISSSRNSTVAGWWTLRVITSSQSSPAW